MAKIFIAHTPSESEMAHHIGEALASYGYIFSCNADAAVAGANLESGFELAFRGCVGAVVIISPDTASGAYAQFEIAMIARSAKESDSFFIVPVRLDGAEIPAPISHLRFIDGDARDPRTLASKISSSIDRLEELRFVQRAREAREVKTANSIADYVQEALKALEKREHQDRIAARVWSAAGYISLLLGPAIGVYWTSRAEEIAALPWHVMLIVMAKGIVTLAFLVGMAKFSFGFARAHMSEARRNADRSHAIAFGKFFLSAFGDRVTPREVRRVFEHWNINSPSAFASLDANEFDPKVMESALRLTETVTALPANAIAKVKKSAKPKSS